MNKVSFDIASWYARLDPEVKGNILRGLAGAAVGGGAAATISALTPQDRERKRGVLGPALLGALLGGGGAVAVPAGLKMLNNGGLTFPGETSQPAGSKLLDKTLDSTVFKHPAALLAGGGAAWKFRDSIRALGHGMSHSKGLAVAPGAVANTAAPVLRRLKETLAGPGAKAFWDAPKDVYMRRIGLGKPGILTSRGRLAMIPAAIAAGIVGDKYLKGQW